jgi:prophage antirepressor-like protein
MADQYLTPIPFLYQGEHLVRGVVGADGEPWFVVPDIARFLGYRDAEKALRIVANDEKGTLPWGTLGGKQVVSIVSESGFYTLAFRSNKPNAIAFRRWVTHEVLPSIRRTGGYRTGGEAGTARANATALNAASRAVGEIRRSLGARAAAETLPDIFGKAGVTVAPHKPPQAELPLDVEDEDRVVPLHPVE